MLKINGIFLPGEHRTLDCLVPGCGARFLEDQRRRWELHCIRCSEEHQERLWAQSMRRRAPDLFDEHDPRYNGDLVLQRWIKDNRDAVIEGRKKI